MNITKILGALLTGTLVLVLGYPSTANAASTLPRNNGAIAFSRTSLSLENIWRMNSDGERQRPMTYRGGSNPVWSPDGGRLVSTNALSQRLQIMRSDGSNLRNLSNEGGVVREYAAAWNRNSTHVAFVREQGSGTAKRHAIIVSNQQNNREVAITSWSRTVRYQSLSWSPDGTQIVYEQVHGTSASLRIIDVHTRHSKELVSLSDVTPSANVSWSASGKKILYNDSANEVYTIWADGTHRSVISDGESYGASWSPDGTSIAFLEARGFEGISISTSDGMVVQMPVPQGNYEMIHAPVWSPDGKKLLFAMTRSTDGTPTSDLFSYNIDTSSTTKLARNITGGYDWQATTR
jgi:Tol biopolymer transport system component